MTLTAPAALLWGGQQYSPDAEPLVSGKVLHFAGSAE
jgi:hypothetical protein